MYLWVYTKKKPPSYWIKLVYLKPQKQSKKLAETFITQIVYNCNKRTTAIKQGITYFTDGSNESFSDHYIAEMDFQEVTPDSTGEYALNYVCKGKRIESRE